VIAGIGHDVDVPIASLVADLEESTPTGTAHAINASWMRLQNVALLEHNIMSGFEGMMALVMSRARIVFGEIFSAGKAVISKVRMLEQKFGHLLENLGSSIKMANEQLSRIARTIEFANPERNLRLGYSIVRGAGGKVVSRIRDVKKNEELTTQVADGTITSNIIKTS